jgi:hypothetical protein
MRRVDVFEIAALVLADSELRIRRSGKSPVYLKQAWDFLKLIPAERSTKTVEQFRQQLDKIFLE